MIEIKVRFKMVTLFDQAYLYIKVCLDIFSEDFYLGLKMKCIIEVCINHLHWTLKKKTLTFPLCDVYDLLTFRHNV